MGLIKENTLPQERLSFHAYSVELVIILWQVSMTVTHFANFMATLGSKEYRLNIPFRAYWVVVDFLIYLLIIYIFLLTRGICNVWKNTCFYTLQRCFTIFLVLNGGGVRVTSVEFQQKRNLDMVGRKERDFHYYIKMKKKKTFILKFWFFSFPFKTTTAIVYARSVLLIISKLASQEPPPDLLLWVWSQV